MLQQPANPAQHPTQRYVYVWAFDVAPERMQEFLSAYGPSGAWAQLFRRAPGYLETLLLQDQSDPGRFLTIDRWRSQGARDAFLAEFRAEYDALDRACEPLTRHESNLGSYWEVVDPAA